MQEGLVGPRTGGMSVSIGDPMLLPAHRRPAALAGTGKDPVFRLRRRHVPVDLTVRVDPDVEGHAFLEPARQMPIDTYAEMIASTQRRWRAILKP